MKKKCPNCGKDISYLEVSKQIEGSVKLSDLDKLEPLYPIEWKPPQEQEEPIIFTCPECLTEIEDETLEEWGLMGEGTAGG